jgi:hypothetical protein
MNDLNLNSPYENFCGDIKPTYKSVFHSLELYRELLIAENVLELRGDPCDSTSISKRALEELNLDKAYKQLEKTISNSRENIEVAIHRFLVEYGHSSTSIKYFFEKLSRLEYCNLERLIDEFFGFKYDEEN